MNFQNATFNSFYYGVSAADETPTRRRYSASGGYSGADLRTGAIRRIGSTVVSGFVGVSNISGATFANSPLVQQTTGFYAGVPLYRLFKKSDELSHDNSGGEMQ